MYYIDADPHFIPPEHQTCGVCHNRVKDKCQIEVCGHRFCFQCLLSRCRTKNRNICPECETPFALVRCRFSQITDKTTKQWIETYDCVPIRSFHLYSLIRKESEHVRQDFKDDLIGCVDYERRIGELHKVLAKLNIASDAFAEDMVDEKLDRIEDQLREIIDREADQQLDILHRPCRQVMASTPSTDSDDSETEESEDIDRQEISPNHDMIADKANHFLWTYRKLLNLQFWKTWALSMILLAVIVIAMVSSIEFVD